jgi:hypothetical protein
VPAKAWGELVVSILESVLARYGLAGYRETWEDHEFPIGLYLRLLEHRKSGFRLGGNRNQPANTRSTKLSSELQVLRRLARHK